jgi:hypothetical protein
MRALTITAVLEKESSIVMPPSADAESGSESESEPDFGGLLEEQLLPALKLKEPKKKAVERGGGWKCRTLNVEVRSFNMLTQLELCLICPSSVFSAKSRHAAHSLSCGTLRHAPAHLVCFLFVFLC